VETYLSLRRENSVTCKNIGDQDTILPLHYLPSSSFCSREAPLAVCWLSCVRRKKREKSSFLFCFHPDNLNQSDTEPFVVRCSYWVCQLYERTVCSMNMFRLVRAACLPVLFALSIVASAQSGLAGIIGTPSDAAQYEIPGGGFVNLIAGIYISTLRWTASRTGMAAHTVKPLCTTVTEFILRIACLQFLRSGFPSIFITAIFPLCGYRSLGCGEMEV